MHMHPTYWIFVIFLLPAVLAEHNSTTEFEIPDYCSLNNTDGHCLLTDEECVHGECRKKCSPSAMDGFCKSGLRRSLRERKCINGVCKERCSLVYTTGYCDDDIFGGKRQCILGLCSDGRCSYLVLDGFCESDGPVKQICIDGQCKEMCSTASKKGHCNSFLETCVNGRCRSTLNKCSSLVPYGYCDSDSLTCKDGICQSNADLEGKSSFGQVGTILLIIFLGVPYFVFVIWCKQRIRSYCWSIMPCCDPCNSETTMNTSTENLAEPRTQSLSLDANYPPCYQHETHTECETPAPSNQSILKNEDSPPPYSSLQNPLSQRTSSN